MTPANLTILPGSLLPLRGLYQQLADGLPSGTMLVVVPAGDGPQRIAFESVARVLAARGQRVTTVSVDTVCTSHRQLALPLLT
jgi:hypothetical protein